MSKLPYQKIDFEKEVKQCAIVNPYDALQSEFAKKLLGHLVGNSKYKEQYLKKIISKLDDEKQTLTPDEWKDFLGFMQEHKDFFDALVKRYKWQFPAWVQFEVDSETLDMAREDHILYWKWKYLSMDKIRNYVRSRIKWKSADGIHEGLIETLGQTQWGIEYFGRQVKRDRELYYKFMAFNYSHRINKHGIKIHNLNGLMFCSLETPLTPYATFEIKDLNYEGEDFTKGKSFANLKNNPKYRELLKKTGAKSFESIEESNSFHFKLMQMVADHLWFEKTITIDLDFVDNPENKKKVKIITAALHALTGNTLWIPYMFNKKGIASIIQCESEDDPVVMRPYGNEEGGDEEQTPLSFLLEVDPSQEWE